MIPHPTHEKGAGAVTPTPSNPPKEIQLNKPIVPAFPEGHTCPEWCIRDHFEGADEPLFSFDALCVSSWSGRIWFVKNDTTQEPGVTGLSIEVEMSVYTLAEAREIAQEILRAADEAEGLAA